MNRIGSDFSAIQYKAVGGVGIGSMQIGGKISVYDISGNMSEDITKNISSAIKTHIIGGDFPDVLKALGNIQTELSDPVLVKDSVATQFSSMLKGMQVTHGNR